MCLDQLAVLLPDILQGLQRLAIEELHIAPEGALQLAEPFLLLLGLPLKLPFQALGPLLLARPLPLERLV